MAQQGADDIAAFNLLRDEARATRQKLAELAARLLAEVSRGQ
jgi:AmiR/NasT family two-component response regulator